MAPEDQPWQLWSTDLFDGEASPSLQRSAATLRAGLVALWGAVLREGVLDDGRPTFTAFSLRAPGEQPVTLPRDPRSNPELARLRARLGEEDFAARLAEVHEPLVRQPFSFAPFLAVPVVLPPPVAQVARLLAATLAPLGPVVATGAGWRWGPQVAVTRSDSPDGLTAWTVSAEGLRVRLVEAARGGWTHSTSSDGSAAALVLRDALVTAGW